MDVARKNIVLKYNIKCSKLKHTVVYVKKDTAPRLRTFGITSCIQFPALIKVHFLASHSRLFLPSNVFIAQNKLSGVIFCTLTPYPKTCTSNSQ